MQRFSVSEMGTLWQWLGGVLADRQGLPIHNLKEVNSTSSLRVVEVDFALHTWPRAQPSRTHWLQGTPSRELDLEMFSGCVLKLSHT